MYYNCILEEGAIEIIQDKICRRKHVSTGANFVHDYLEIWDTGRLKFAKFSKNR